MVIKVERFRLIKTIIPPDSLVGLRTCGASRLLPETAVRLETGSAALFSAAAALPVSPITTTARTEVIALVQSQLRRSIVMLTALSLPVISLLSFINFRPSPERVAAPG